MTEQSFVQRFRSKVQAIFFAGLLATIPLAITFFFLRFFFLKIDEIFNPITAKLLTLAGLEIAKQGHIPGLGIVTGIIIIFGVGLFVRNFIGSSIVGLYEAILTRIPVLKSIYVGAKQIMETIGSSRENSFDKVVMIEYPRKGVHALAFITGKSRGEVNRLTEKDMVNIFLPTTPNPTSGFFLLIPADEIIELKMSVEEGVKMIISGGLVTPPDPENVAKSVLKNGAGS